VGPHPVTPLGGEGWTMDIHSLSLISYPVKLVGGGDVEKRSAYTHFGKRPGRLGRLSSYF